MCYYCRALRDIYTPSQDENSGKREIIFLGIPAQLGSIFIFEIQHKTHIVRSAVKVFFVLF